MKRKNPKKRELTAQSLLIHRFIKFYGGLGSMAQAVTKKLKVEEFSYQNFANWRNRNGVPLKEVFRIADRFRVPPAALNYVDVTKTLPPRKRQTWEEVVNECKFLSLDDKLEILKLEAPRNE